MSNLRDATALNFPERREAVRGIWKPIFLEPMIGSGERLCVAIAAATNAGTDVIAVPGLPRLECIYGDAVEMLLHSTDLVVTSLRMLLATRGTDALRTWRPHVEGFYLGNEVQSSAGSMTEFLRTALGTSASLVEKLADSEDAVEERYGLTSARLEDQVRERVLQKRPQLASRFAIKHRRAEGQRPIVFGFVGDVLAANFGLLVPIRLSLHVKDVKSKLWDLAHLREDSSRDMLIEGRPWKFEMLVHKPDKDDPSFSTQQLRSVDEAERELFAEADDQRIMLRAVTGVEKLAEAVLVGEAA